MSDITGDLQRRLANIVRRGVIHSVKHDGIPKCRVDLGDIITTWLPLCQSFSGANRADSNPYAVGDAVTVLSEAGDLPVQIAHGGSFGGLDAATLEALSRGRVLCQHLPGPDRSGRRTDCRPALHGSRTSLRR